MSPSPSLVSLHRALRHGKGTSTLVCQACGDRLFHTVPRRHADSNYYETLGVEPGASQADVKKQYYKLSKSTHPDRNPEDPNAASRFSAVSDAYATLGNPDKRARYDRDVMRHGESAPRKGSHSSGQSTPWGGRPASGLSKRRSTFRGPPSSFYKSGGYGQYGAQRSAQAEAEAANARRKAQEDKEGQSAGTAGGFSPGQGAPRGFDNDVPHFDREGHFRTQETVQGTISRRRQRLHRNEPDLEGAASFGTVSAFVLVSSIVAVAVAVPTWLFRRSNKKSRGDG